jgi:hypothetical protein
MARNDEHNGEGSVGSRDRGDTAPGTARHSDEDHRASAAEQRLQQSADRADVTQRSYQGADAPAPRRPDERDESADSQASQTPDGSGPRAVMERAHADLAVGQVDTDQHSRAANELMRRLQEQDRAPELSDHHASDHKASDHNASEHSTHAHNSNPHPVEDGK